MNATHYIGFDVHKKTISYCVKTSGGQIVEEGTLAAQRAVLRGWAEGQQQAWHGAMEATLFSAWIYDTLKPYAQRLDMGHPAKMKAITAGKKKSDCIDAGTIADLVRCELLPTCYVFPPQLRDLRRLLRHRNLVVQQSVRMQNKMAGLLMESGVSFNKEKLHGKKYFADLMKTLQEVPESVKDLLHMSRGTMEMFQGAQKQLIQRLLADSALEQRVQRLTSTGAQPPQPRYLASGVQTCGLPARRRQERPALPVAHSASASNRDNSQEEKESSFSASGLTGPVPPLWDYTYVRSVSGPPADPHVKGDCARGA